MKSMKSIINLTESELACIIAKHYGMDIVVGTTPTPKPDGTKPIVENTKISYVSMSGVNEDVKAVAGGSFIRMTFQLTLPSLTPSLTPHIIYPPGARGVSA